MALIRKDSFGVSADKRFPELLAFTSSAAAAFNTSALASLLQSSRKLEDFEWTEQERPSLAHNEFNYDLPLIDLAALSSRRGAKREKCISKMSKACKEWGVFQVINHGIPCDLIQKMETQARRFFKLGLNEKRRVLRGTAVKPLGYTYADVGTTVKNDLPWMEALQLPSHPNELEEVICKIWLDGNENFSAVAHEYNKTMKTFALQLLELLTSKLGLESNYISQHLEEGNNSVFRFNYYPPCPQPSLTLGLGAHSDPHVLTILHQDEVGGLQILKDKKWIGVRPKPSSLVINVGDALQVWSNDIYKSVEHRAVCNSTKGRLSIPFFLNPGEQTVISPAKELIPSQDSEHYRHFTWQEYRQSMYTHRPRGKSNLMRFRLEENHATA
eukprot:c53629_g1_i1 orf=217-1371(-)